MKNKLRTITAFILLLALVISFVPVAHASSLGELPTDNGNDETSESSDATDTSNPPDETTEVTEGSSAPTETALTEDTHTVGETTALTPINDKYLMLTEENRKLFIASVYALVDGLLIRQK